jgi:uncharacterized protein (DUF302 family)
MSMTPWAGSSLGGVVSRQCTHTVDEVLRNAVGLLEGHGLVVFNVIDHSGEAMEVGLPMSNTKLILFDSPVRGAKVILREPLAAIELPLKLLIWEQPPDRVFISYHSPEYLAARHGLDGQESTDLQRIASIVEELASQ